MQAAQRISSWSVAQRHRSCLHCQCLHLSLITTSTMMFWRCTGFTLEMIVCLRCLVDNTSKLQHMNASDRMQYLLWKRLPQECTCTWP